MDDVVSVGREPRPPRRRRPRPRRRAWVLAGVVTVVLGSTGLVVATSLSHGDAARVTGTGRTCTVGYGTDLVVAAVEVANPSPRVPATLSGVGLGPSARSAVGHGGPIDIVTASGCEHVLALRGDVVAPRDRVWLGITVQIATCTAVSVPVVVAYGHDGVQRETTVAVPLTAYAAPVCAVAVGAARGG